MIFKVLTIKKIMEFLESKLLPEPFDLVLIAGGIILIAGYLVFGL